ncbi:peptide-methionine (S)-S-oxide reductase MsrA [Candidatus Saccharibacteria bacterium]|nr:peptide-methionine (S)-S-oxide reductase MsrA [Candidatus Saccharibacteria bacterium]
MPAETATFAGGCFWCTDAIFRKLKGVEKVTVGYAGGEKGSPTYEEVSTGSTGHLEAVQIEFDPEVVSFEELLDVFWTTHDPTQTGGQGPDVGPQYQAAVFYHSDEQKSNAEKSKRSLEESGQYKEPIMTQILPFKTFFPAEEYHQDYFAKNPHAPYCQVVIKPKVEKVENLFPSKLIENRNSE